MPHAASTVTARTLGRYELLQEIGRGGMASVHLGRSRGLAGFERTVAIKCCHPAMASAPDAVTMFLDEARLAAKIHHPNVVATLDVGLDEVLYLVMEYIEGDKLSTLIGAANRRGERIPVPVALRIMIDALTGLHAAHTLRDGAGRPLGIVHRDISPQNILVGADGVTRIADFGIAKAEAQAGITGHGVVRGKLGYIAPERFGSRDSLRLCDVFAAGVVLWEALTGVRLFHAATDDETVAQVLRCEVPPPSELEASLPPALDAIVLRAVERQPEARYATAQDFAVALENGPVRPALGRDVADYVARVLGPVLAARRDFVAQLDATGDVEPVSDEAVTRLWNPPSDPAVARAAEPVDLATERDLGAHFAATTATATATATTARLVRPRARGLAALVALVALVALASVAVPWARERARATPRPTTAPTASPAPPVPSPPPLRAAVAPAQPPVVAATAAADPPGRIRAPVASHPGAAPASRAVPSTRPAAEGSHRPRTRPTGAPREFRPGVV